MNLSGSADFQNPDSVINEHFLTRLLQEVSRVACQTSGAATERT